MAEVAAWLVVLIGAIALLASIGRRSRGPGSAAAGTIYDMLNEDKRNALEIIVEQRAEARDPRMRTATCRIWRTRPRCRH
jgi:hypothetical protein